MHAIAAVLYISMQVHSHSLLVNHGPEAHALHYAVDMYMVGLQVLLAL
jgi:hypothetical protein